MFRKPNFFSNETDKSYTNKDINKILYTCEFIRMNQSWNRKKILANFLNRIWNDLNEKKQNKYTISINLFKHI